MHDADKNKKNTEIRFNFKKFIGDVSNWSGSATLLVGTVPVPYPNRYHIQKFE